MPTLLRRIARWFERLWRRSPPRYTLTFVDTDEIPATLPRYVLVVAREGDTLWAAGMRCPCGCDRKLEMMLLPEVKPRWQLTEGKKGPSLHPSVWANSGCRSHFWLTDGLVHWCKD